MGEYLPYGVEVVAKELGARIKEVRQARNLSMKDAAEHVGMREGDWRLLEAGVTIPIDHFLKRISKWIFENESYKGHPRPKWNPTTHPGAKRSILKVTIPTDLSTETRTTCKKWGMMIDDYVTVALEFMVRNPNVAMTLERAYALLRKANITRILKAKPSVRDILSSDLEAAKDMTDPPHMAPGLFSEAERLLEKLEENSPPMPPIEMFKVEEEDPWEPL